MKRDDILKKLHTALGDFHNLLVLREISGSDVEKICDTEKDVYIDNLREDFLVLEKYGADKLLHEARGIGNMDYFRTMTGILRSPPSFESRLMLRKEMDICERNREKLLEYILKDKLN